MSELKRALASLALTFLCSGCATSFQPASFPLDHPANPQAREGVRQSIPNLLASDKLLRQADARLSKNAPMRTDHEPSGMSSMQHEGRMKMDAPAEKTGTGKAYYTCVMHPKVHQDKPGACPICGMTLVKKEGDKP